MQGETNFYTPPREKWIPPEGHDAESFNARYVDIAANYLESEDLQKLGLSAEGEKSQEKIKEDIEKLKRLKVEAEATLQGLGGTEEEKPVWEHNVQMVSDLITRLEGKLEN